MTPTHARYFTYHRRWWLRPAVLLPSALLILASVPMVLWIASYESVMGVVIFVVTYFSLLFILIRFIRTGLLDPHSSANEKAVRQARKEIQDHRARERSAVAQHEVALLTAGTTTPVLDVWRLDPRYRQRHAWFGGLRTMVVDPAARELRLLVHLEPTEDGNLVDSLKTFLPHVSGDAHVVPLRAYADAVVLEVDVLQVDLGLTGTPVPALSYRATFAEVDRYTKAGGGLPFGGEVRYADGAPVEPHRAIPWSGASGLK